MKFRIDYEEWYDNCAFGVTLHYMNKNGRAEYETDVILGLIVNLFKYQWEFILADG